MLVQISIFHLKMKALILLLAVIASCYADDAAAVHGCFTEATNSKQCIAKEVNETQHKNFQVLAEFNREIQACLSTAGCSLPQTQPHQIPAGSAPNPPVQLPANSRVTECSNGIVNNLQNCLKAEGIELPADFHPDPRPRPEPGGAGGLGGPGGPHPQAAGFHTHFFSGGINDLVAVQNFTKQICNNDAANAKTLLTCALGVVAKGNYLPALYSFVKPEALICSATATCFKSNPISSDCIARLATFRQALCKCKSGVEEFVKSADACVDVRERMHALPSDPALGSHLAFDMCNGDPERVCKDLAEELGNIRSKLAQATARTSS